MMHVWTLTHNNNNISNIIKAIKTCIVLASTRMIHNEMQEMEEALAHNTAASTSTLKSSNNRCLMTSYLTRVVVSNYAVTRIP